MRKCSVTIDVIPKIYKKSKKSEMHICHAGLVDVAVPIIHNDSIVGYVIFGQIRTESEYSRVEKYVARLGLDTEKMNKLYGDIPLSDSLKIDSVLNIATVLAKHIMLENMLKPDYDKVLDAAVSYINKNLENILPKEQLNNILSVINEPVPAYQTTMKLAKPQIENMIN